MFSASSAAAAAEVVRGAVAPGRFGRGRLARVGTGRLAGAALAALLTVAVPGAAAVAAPPADAAADRPGPQRTGASAVLGDLKTFGAAVVRDHGTETRLPAGLFQMAVEGGGTLQTYGLDPRTPVQSEARYQETPWRGTSLHGNANAGRIRWILHNSYPQVNDLAALAKRSGVPALSEEEAAAGTQVAVWRYAAADGTGITVEALAPRAERLADFLVARAKRLPEPRATLSLDSPAISGTTSAPPAVTGASAAGATADGGSRTAEDASGSGGTGDLAHRFGPVTVRTSARTVSVAPAEESAAQGIRVVDGNGRQVQTARDGSRLYFEVRPRTEAPEDASDDAAGDASDDADGSAAAEDGTGADPAAAAPAAKGGDGGAADDPAGTDASARKGGPSAGGAPVAPETAGPDGTTGPDGSADPDEAAPSTPRAPAAGTAALTVQASTPVPVGRAFTSESRSQTQVLAGSSGTAVTATATVRWAPGGAIPAVVAEEDCDVAGVGVTVANAGDEPFAFEVAGMAGTAAPGERTSTTVPVVEDSGYDFAVTGPDGFEQRFEGVLDCAPAGGVATAAGTGKGEGLAPQAAPKAADGAGKKAAVAEQDADDLATTGASDTTGTVLVVAIALLSAGVLLLVLKRNKRE
ncbi:Cys-Gln thioester bond-forming surface protein [Streptomyces sp. NPDC060194]|uniref:Cys-Gln thioester bond-forming surface protein n=1 Tax=Streptomyces sp. NPDC060194 TaxID=3347069 RepID=UPI00364C4138